MFSRMTISEGMTFRCICFLVCLFWLQKRGCHFVASATIMCMSFLTAKFAITIISFLVCLFWLQKRGWHFVASATIMCMSFLIAKFAITIISFLVCLFWLQKRGWHFVASATIMCMSFLTAKFAITIISFLVCLFWLQKRGWHFVASATIMCMSFLTAKFAGGTTWYVCWKHGGDLQKDLAVLAAGLRSQRGNTRVRFYYIHFKELESRYMSPIQGIDGRIPHNNTYTTNEMNHDVYFALSQSSTLNKKRIFGENLLRDL